MNKNEIDDAEIKLSDNTQIRNHIAHGIINIL